MNTRAQGKGARAKESATDARRPVYPPQHEKFVQALVRQIGGGKRLCISGAYRDVYPRASAATARSASSALLGRPHILARLEHLLSTAAKRVVLTIERRKEMLGLAAEARFKGPSQFFRKADNGGVLPVSDALSSGSPALHSVRVRRALDSGGEPYEVMELSTHDFLSCIKELNEMEGVYPPRQVKGSIDLLAHGIEFVDEDEEEEG